MLMRGHDGSLTIRVFRDPLPSDSYQRLVRTVGEIVYFRDGRMIIYTPEPLRLPPPRDTC